MPGRRPRHHVDHERLTKGLFISPEASRPPLRPPSTHAVKSSDPYVPYFMIYTFLVQITEENMPPSKSFIFIQNVYERRRWPTAGS